MPLPYIDKYIFYFEDEKLVKFEFCEGGYTQFTADMSGIVYDDIRSGQPTYTCVFSNYGTTAVELPTA